MRNKLIVAALVVVGLASVAYAAFAQTLTISGTSTVTGDWDVEIISITRTSATGATDHASTPSFSATTATFDVDLAYPGATATYDVVMKNLGNINAKVGSIPSVTSVNAAAPTDVVYSVSGVAVNDPLAPGATVTSTVTVTWQGSASSNVPAATKTATLSYNFVQDT
ncbi:hypothetical protein KBD87_01435 [Candidatus Saccharibacteria bacterium]|jgi:uncharacterized membrane protein|nr:hypothetical protein [Candidatus Saccharibacteria bacterium]